MVRIVDLDGDYTSEVFGRLGGNVSAITLATGHINGTDGQFKIEGILNINTAGDAVVGAANVSRVPGTTKIHDPLLGNESVDIDLRGPVPTIPIEPGTSLSFTMTIKTGPYAGYSQDVVLKK